jgi:hypothetical protein
MYEGGETYAMIAAALGRSVKSVESIRRKMDLPARDNPALAQKAKREALADPTRRMRKDFERSQGPTLQEHNAGTRAKAAVNYHFADLHKAYGGGDVYISKDRSQVKAASIDRYRRLNELDIPLGAERTLIIPSVMHISACSSPAGWMS